MRVKTSTCQHAFLVFPFLYLQVIFSICPLLRLSAQHNSRSCDVQQYLADQCADVFLLTLRGTLGILCRKDVQKCPGRSSQLVFVHRARACYLRISP